MRILSKVNAEGKMVSSADKRFKEQQRRQNTSFYGLRKRLEQLIHGKLSTVSPQGTYPMHIHILNSQMNSTVIYSQRPEFLDSDNKLQIAEYESVVHKIYSMACEGTPNGLPSFQCFIESSLSFSLQLKKFGQDFAAVYFADRGQKLTGKPSILEELLKQEYTKSADNKYRRANITHKAGYPELNAGYFNLDTAPFVLAEYLQFRTDQPIHEFLEGCISNRIAIFLLPFKVLNQHRGALVIYCQDDKTDYFHRLLDPNVRAVTAVLEAQASQIVLGEVSFSLQFDLLASSDIRNERILLSLGSLWFCTQIEITKFSGKQYILYPSKDGATSSLFQLNEQYNDCVHLTRNGDGISKHTILDILQAKEVSFLCPLLEGNDDDENNRALSLSYIKTMSDSVEGLKELTTKNLQGRVNDIFKFTTAIYKDTLETMDGLSSNNNPISQSLTEEQRLSCIFHLSQTYWAIGELTNYSEKTIIKNGASVGLDLFGESEPTQSCLEFWGNYFKTRGFYQIASQVGKANTSFNYKIEYCVKLNGVEKESITLQVVKGRVSEFPYDSLVMDWDAVNLWPLPIRKGRSTWATPALCYISGFPMWYIGKIINDFFLHQKDKSEQSVQINLNLHLTPGNFNISIEGMKPITVQTAQIAHWEKALKGVYGLNQHKILTLENDILSQHIDIRSG